MTPLFLAFTGFPFAMADEVSVWGAALGGMLVAGLAVWAGLRGGLRRREAASRAREVALEAEVSRLTRAERLAHESEERFARAFHASPVIAAISSDPDGGYLEVNRCYTESLGYTLEEVKGRTALELGIWVVPQQRNAIVSRIEQGGMVRGVECKLRAKSGRVLTVLTSVERVEIAGRRALLFVSLDVSERMQAEAEHEKLVRLIERSGDLIGLADLDGKLTYLNAAGRRMVGLGEREALGRVRISDYVPVAAREFFEKMVVPTARREGTWEGEMQLVDLKTGELKDVWRSISLVRDPRTGEPLCFASVTRDISEEKRAYAALREREEQLALFVEHAPAPLAMLDCDLRYLVVSNRWLLDFGLAGRDLTGLRHDEVLPWMSERFQAVYQRCLAGSVERGEADRFRRPDGSTQWMRWKVRPWFLSEGTTGGIIILCEDITQRRRSDQRRATEHAVTQVLAEGRVLAEVAPKVLEAICRSEDWQFGAMWAIDEKGDSLRCVEAWGEESIRASAVERETRRIGFAMGEGLPGRVWASGESIVIPDVRQDPRFLRSQAAGELGLRSAVGFPIRVGAEITGVVDFLSREAIEPSTEREEMFALIGSLVGQFIARTTTQEELRRFVALNPSVLYALRITGSRLQFFWVSENLEAMTGFTPEEAARGAWWSDHIHPEDRERVFAASPTPYEIEHQVLEFRFRRKDGNYLWLRDEKRLLRDSSGRPSQVIGAWSDVTARVTLEAQLRQAQKMEAIGLLSGGIAHDFNNILGAIVGNARLASMDIPAGHPAAESVDEIHKAAQRAAALVRQILAFARQERRERHRVDLWDVVQESARLLRATLPSGVELRAERIGTGTILNADETQLQQVILNLGTNAWHALEGRPGHIQIVLEHVEVDAAFAARHPVLRPGPAARLRMIDSGKGMDAATLERIFDPFFTTKPTGEGTGLGLSVVHGIVQAHQGAVVVSSTPGAGSTFDLYFPVAEDSTPAEPNIPSAPRIGNGERLLFIDDEVALVSVAARGLERLRYRVDRFTDPALALEAFRREPDAFSLVITDLNMPAVSGLDVARAVRRLRPAQPVLLCSGFLSDALRDQAGQSGVAGIVRKPCTLETLSEAIAQAILGKTWRPTEGDDRGAA